MQFIHTVVDLTTLLKCSILIVIQVTYDQIFSNFIKDVCCLFNFLVILLQFLETVVGTHDSAIRAIEYASEVQGILTGSWDATVKMWDPRQPRCVGTYQQPDKVSIFSPKLCIIFVRHILILTMF